MRGERRRDVIGLAALAGSAAVLGASGAFAQTAPAGGTLQQIRTRGELRVGVAQAEPWFFKDQRTGEWHGIGWGVATAIARELGVKTAPVETTWGTAVAGLQAGQFDVMLVLDATPQRALAVDFPVQPLLYIAQSVLVRDGLTVRRWEDLNRPELRVGAILGTAADRDVTALLPRAQIERFPTSDESAAAFQAGRIDALCQYHPALTLLRARVRRGTIVVPEPARLAGTSGGVQREPDKSWRDWLGIAFASLYFSGETQKIYEDYLRFRNIDPATAPAVMRELWQSR